MNDDEELDPFLRQFLAGVKAKEQRNRSLAWGCSVPALLLVAIILLAIINPH